jgi:hypothetical protein
LVLKRRSVPTWENASIYGNEGVESRVICPYMVISPTWENALMRTKRTPITRPQRVKFPLN